MKTIPAPPPTQEAPITSVQPGGGLCFSLERAWGAARRSLLRRFFPAHIERMNRLRQGDCPGCPHDIIDSRDLKLYRNVCGFSFRSEDDPYAWRGRLGFARAGFAEILCLSLLLLPLMGGGAFLALWLHPAWWSLVVVFLGLWIFVLAFFRDPPRSIPPQPDALICPADGVITHLEEVDEPGFGPGKAFRVSIFLSVFNVHVNRIPRSGTISHVAYFPGEFLDARAGECPVRNEQLWVDMQDAQLDCRIRVKQIAGAIARRIVCWLRRGEEVIAGERFGMIKFGSRTDVYVPADKVASVDVKVGQAVRGGADILLRLHSRHVGSPAPDAE